MKIQSDPDLHLTYCLNIHPGESFEEMISAVEGPATRVKAACSPGQPFGLGIRLGAGTLKDLMPEELEQFRDFLDRRGMYVFTVNAFPYGDFHGTRVKENVYAPDWRSDERREYTERVVRILGQLLPDGVDGSVSTVPVSYKAWIQTASDRDEAIDQLMGAVKECIALEEATGKKVSIALEPEPDCLLEDIDGTVEFFNEHLFTSGAGTLAGITGMNSADSEAAVRRYLGVCFDTCHLAVRFEDPVDGLGRLAMEGISVPKIQLSSAIQTVLSGETRECLEGFIDSVYFHQTCTRDEAGNVKAYMDLDKDLLDSLGDGLELRTHFHVPLWFTEQDGLEGTAIGLTDEFFTLLGSGISPHIEAETYTFDVLPEDLRSGDVAESVAKELEWVKDRLS